MRTIIFDLDGTLIHSVPSLHFAVNAMLRDLGRSLLTEAQVTGFVGEGAAVLVQRSLDATGGVGETPFDAALDSMLAHYRAAPPELTKPYPGAASLLAALSAAGAPMALCTNKPAELTHKVLAQLELAPHFRVVVGGDTLPVRKPDPKPLLHCIDALGGTVGSAVFVGDSETDAATARAAKVSLALYTEGYRKSPVEDLGASFVFSDHGALQGHLLARHQ